MPILSDFFFFIDKKLYIDKKKKKKEYTGEAPRANKKKKTRRKEETNKPIQKDHTLGIAMKSIQKQSNKRDIRLRNETNPGKERTDNRKFQSPRRKSNIVKDNSILFFPNCPKQKKRSCPPNSLSFFLTGKCIQLWIRSLTRKGQVQEAPKAQKEDQLWPILFDN